MEAPNPSTGRFGVWHPVEKHQLDLLANAIDSLEEALVKYRDGVENRNVKSFKFAVLHFSHFAELLLKHYVASQHPFLIYRDPFAKSLQGRQTIALHDAVNFIRNEGKDLDAQFVSDLEWLKRLRNEIEHYRFEMEILQVRMAMGRLARATEKFIAEYCGFKLFEQLGWGRFGDFIELKDDYEQRLIEAKAHAKSCVSEDGTLSSCFFCGNSGTAYESEDGYQCAYCEELDPFVVCIECSSPVRFTEARDWDAVRDRWMCEHCYERVNYEMDHRD